MLEYIFIDIEWLMFDEFFQDKPKLQTDVRPFKQKAPAVNLKLKQSRYWRQGAVLSACPMRVAPA